VKGGPRLCSPFRDPLLAPPWFVRDKFRRKQWQPEEAARVAEAVGDGDPTNRERTYVSGGNPTSLAVQVGASFSSGAGFNNANCLLFAANVFFVKASVYYPDVLDWVSPRKVVLAIASA
jgi:hypothetical protein